MPKVVIVGAGFGGLAAAHALRGAPVEVVLVDARNYHTFQPLLYQVATAALDPEDIAHSVRGIFQRRRDVDFRLGSVQGIDLDGRRVLFEEGEPLAYDWLILAAGAMPDFFGVAGADEHAMPLKSLDEAVAVRSHVLARFEEAAADPSAIDRGALTFVIVGGGPTGVELAGALVELFHKVLRRDFPHLDVGGARVLLLEATDRLLGTFHPRSQRSALETLRARGVEVRLGAVVDHVVAGAVQLRDGESIACETLVWAAGVRASPLADVLGVERGGAGRVVVGADLRMPGRSEVFVIGDLAAVRAAGSGGWLPQLAPVAIQGGRHAAAEIERALRGDRPRPFVYRDRGTMATIGRNAAVAELPLGLRVRGRLAWVLWLVLHLVMLIGFRNRLAVLVDWSWNYVTYDRSARLILGRGGRRAPG